MILCYLELGNVIETDWYIKHKIIQGQNNKYELTHLHMCWDTWISWICESYLNQNTSEIISDEQLEINRNFQ